MAEMTFDADLKSRLLAFQKAHGLPEDGMVGAKTWTSLVEGESAKQAETGKADEPAVSLDDYPVLAKIVALEPSEEAVKQFLSDECGLDIDAVLADIESRLAETPAT